MGNRENNPLVSVIIPVYNASKHLKEAVDSVLNQTYREFELLVVDDGSKDNSLEILLSYDDPRVRVFTQMNQGACMARNRALQESKGEYVKFVDADDVLYPDALRIQVEQMASLAENEAVFGDFDFIDENGKLFYHNTLDEKVQHELEVDQDYWIFKYWDMVTTCPLHHKENLMKVGGFNIRLADHQERLLHFSLSMAGIKFVYRPGSIYGYRSYMSEERLSCARLKVPKLSSVVYLLDLMYDMVQAKYGDKYNRVSTAISDRYFTRANGYFMAGKTAEGRYCLSRCYAIPHYRKHPRYCGKYWLALLYIGLGHIFGFHHVAVWIDKIAKRVGLKSDGDFKASMIYKNPFETE